MNLSFLLYLSSFWGKFGEHEHSVQTIAIREENVWQKIIQDESLVIKDVRIFNEDVIEVNAMKKEKDAYEGAGKTNFFIACFTTALARLKLYAELEKLGEQVLYYTESVIYRWKQGEPFIPTGIFLGEMTDELGGDTIMEFGSAGPKSYCYQTANGKAECKNKGTKSSYEINQVLNCDSMMQHIQQELANPLQCRRLMNIDIKDHFVRGSRHKTVSLKDLVKVLGVNWDRRVVEKSTGITYPYG